MVQCPICDRQVRGQDINPHIDSGCKTHTVAVPEPGARQVGGGNGATKPTTPSAFFASFSASAKKPATSISTAAAGTTNLNIPSSPPLQSSPCASTSRKRRADQSAQLDVDDCGSAARSEAGIGTGPNASATPINDAPSARLENAPSKKPKVVSNGPLAERMRPQSLDEVVGQDLVGRHGILRELILAGRVPSMVLWGPPGTGKTTVARLIAAETGMRFVEINSTTAGVAECKKIFSSARNELGLTGRKTLLFCDEIHRFSKAQQDVFLGPVEAGQVTLIGATTENPSFKVINALLSRCRVFTLATLTDRAIRKILGRALEVDPTALDKRCGQIDSGGAGDSGDDENRHPSIINEDVLSYIAAFANGDGRMALNLLELAISLDQTAGTTVESLKRSLTQTLLYDRAGDGHYNTISALHKSIRGSDADAALFYLSRMLVSGEDPLFIARRLVVIASEDVGLADNTLLPLAIATHSAVEKIGLPEARINLAHTTVALALAPKSTRAYRGLNAAMSAIEDVMAGRSDGPGPSVNPADLDVPLHLQMGVTKLMKEMGRGVGYKYNPNYRDGKVKQDYLPAAFKGRKFLDDLDLGTMVDHDLDDDEMRE